MRAAAENSFTRVLNPHGGAYLQTDFVKYCRTFSLNDFQVQTFKYSCFSYIGIKLIEKVSHIFYPSMSNYVTGGTQGNYCLY